MAAARRIVSLDTVAPFYRDLLQNRGMTTLLIEKLTQTSLRAESANSRRGNEVVRQALLVGGGTVLVAARARIFSACLPAAAIGAILTGHVPLGKILAAYTGPTSRQNFVFFRTVNDWQTALLFGPLAETSVFCRHWLRKVVNNCQGRQRLLTANGPGPIAARPSGAGRWGEFFGRSYEISVQGQPIAQIEEIFSPRLQRKAVQSHRLCQRSAPV